MSATVADIREAKKQLEKDISNLVTNFYDKYNTDLVIHSVDVRIGDEDETEYIVTKVNIRVNL